MNQEQMTKQAVGWHVILQQPVKWWMYRCLCFQLYIQYDPGQVLNVNQNYLSGSQMVQRPGPVQSNVVPTITPSSSFYSGSAGKTEFCLADICRASYIPNTSGHPWNAVFTQM
jgi:hypothetical protein